jgi:hypothetical protein
MKTTDLPSTYSKGNRVLWFYLFIILDKNGDVDDNWIWDVYWALETCNNHEIF